MYLNYFMVLTNEEKKLYNKEYKLKNKEKIKEKNKEYKLKNSEIIKEKNLVYRLKNKEYFHLYYLRNKEKIKEKSKEYKLDNKEKINEYRLNNKEKSREYRLKNKDKIKENNSKYRLNNKELILESRMKYRLNNRKLLTERQIIYHKKRLEYDFQYRLKVNIRTMINKSFYRNGFTKKSRTHEILGCSFDEFKIYLESKFESWMNWENRGLYNGQPNYGWDIDHIIPLSSAKIEEDIIKLNHYTNLQPLCSYTNRHIKSNKFDFTSDNLNV